MENNKINTLINKTTGEEDRDFRPRFVGYGKFEKPKSILALLRDARSKGQKRSNYRSVARGGEKIRNGSNLNQRVIVKTRVVKGKGSPKTMANLRSHIQYLSRSGVEKEHEQAHFFSQNGQLSKEDVKQIVSSWGEDRHHFRFIISPENYAGLDLEEYSKSVFKEMAIDLKDRLNWFAVSHYNTDNPHVHVVLRGVGDDNKTLLIDKNYIRHGLRELAQKEATIRLGYRSESEVRERFKDEIEALKWTSVDTNVYEKQKLSIDEQYKLPKVHELKSELKKFQREITYRRLLFLKKYDLATETTPGVWSIHKDTKEILNEISKTNEIKKLITKHLEEHHLVEPLVIHKKDKSLLNKITGEVIGVGFNNDYQNSKYVLISGFDGKLHFIEPNKFSVPEGKTIKEGQIVTVENFNNRKTSDEVIFNRSQSNGGVFDKGVFEGYFHARVKEGTWRVPDNLTLEEYLDRYTVRLNTLMKTGIITEISPKKYQIPENMFEQVDDLNKKLGKHEYIKINIESSLSLKQQQNYDGRTWLDKIKNNLNYYTNASAVGIKVFNAFKERQKFLTQDQEINLSRRR